MSPNKSATRRLSLLAGSSLVAASLAAFAGVSLAPTTAAAQAVCTPAPSSGGGTNVVTYNGGATAAASVIYDPGITCTASGGAMSVSTTGSITVSTTAGTVGAPAANGINLIGGANAVTWNSTAGAVTGGALTNGAIIDVTTTTGAININTNAVIRRAAPVAERGDTITAGISATSTTGAITIDANGAVNVAASLAGTSAVETTSSGGSISIANTGALGGRLRGILAQTSGSGTVALSVGAGVSASAAAGVGLAAIDTSVGTGSTTINITTGNVSGGAGVAIRSVSASTSALSAVNIQNMGGTVSGGVDFSGVTAGGVTFNNAGLTATTGRWTATGASVFGVGNDTLTMGGAGSNSLAAASSIDFGAGNDAWTMSSLLAATTSTVDFGAGTDTFNMSGRLAVNGLTLNNLEAFNNSGVIYMGGTSGSASDGAADDVLVMTGGTFTGSSESRIVMDVLLDPGVTQAGCATVTMADCLDLRGASTAGVTLVTLNYVGAQATQGSINTDGITLVDVAGAGTSAAGHFVLDPSTEGYVEDRAFGGVIARPGLISYALRYDEANQRHVLIGTPRADVLEYAILAGAAQSIWHMTSEAVTDRQAELRRGGDNTVWVRTTGEYTERDVQTGLDLLGRRVSVDNGYKLYGGTIMAGRDFFAGETNGYDYVIGAQIGYASSSFDLNESDTSGRMSGATGSGYASLWNDWFFVDTALNLNGLTLDYESPGLGSKTTTFLNSIGVHGEAGVRTELTEASFAEPLATLAWVRTSFEEISLSGGEVKPDDATSLRGALGMRLGSTLAGETVSATYFITGRAWYEFEGESGGVVKNPGADLPFADEFTGAFGEAELGVNVFNDAGTLSGFLTSGVKWKDGYSAVNLSLGVRMAW